MSNRTQTSTAIGAEFNRLFERRQADSLTDDERGRIIAVRSALREMEKLMKCIALYGRSHQNALRFREELYNGLIGAMGPLDRIDLGVGPYELNLYDQPVLENPKPEDNFIYKLYLDGVRWISICKGLTAEEMDKLVDILLVDWDDPALFEDDMVTLLWSGNLENIDYRVVENFSDDEAEEDGSIYRVEGILEQVRAMPELTPGKLPIADLSALRVNGKDLGGFKEPDYEMDRMDARTLEAVIHTTSRERLEKFIEILFKIQLAEGGLSDDRAGMITALFDRIADLHLGAGDIGELERLIRIVRRMAGPADAPIRENQVAVDHILEHWSEAPFVERVTADLGEPDYVWTPSVVAICRLLTPRAAPHIAARIPMLMDIDLRNVLMEVVAEKMHGQEREIAELLRTVDSNFAHSLFKLFHHHGERDAMSYAIMVAMKNPDQAVRFEALTALSKEDVDRYLGVLFNALNDKAKSVRSKAIHILARIPRPDVHDRIRKTIQDKPFSQHDLDEKRRYFAACALTGDAAELWLDMFNSGSLLARKGNDDIRHCAAIAMGIRMQKSGVAVIEKEVSKRLVSPSVKEACEWALAHMKCDRETRTSQLYDLFYHGKLKA